MAAPSQQNPRDIEARRKFLQRRRNLHKDKQAHKGYFKMMRLMARVL